MYHSRLQSTSISLCSIRLEPLLYLLHCLSQSGAREHRLRTDRATLRKWFPGPGDRHCQADRQRSRGMWGSCCAALHWPKPADSKFVKSKGNWKIAGPSFVAFFFAQLPVVHFWVCTFFWLSRQSRANWADYSTFTWKHNILFGQKSCSKRAQKDINGHKNHQTGAK